MQAHIYRTEQPQFGETYLKVTAKPGSSLTRYQNYCSCVTPLRADEQGNERFLITYDPAETVLHPHETEEQEREYCLQDYIPRALDQDEQILSFEYLPVEASPVHQPQRLYKKLVNV